MKKIEAVIRKERFSLVDDALKKVGVGGLTVTTAEGRGRSRGEEMVSDRGTKTYRPEYVGRIKLEITVKDSDVQRVVKAILDNATTSSVGDGKVFVSPVEEVYDIASGERGDKAV